MNKHYVRYLLFLFTILVMPVVQAKMPGFITNIVKSSAIIPGQLVVVVPPIAENGDVVPVTIKHLLTEQPGLYFEEVWLFNGESKQQIAHFIFDSSVKALISTRIKMRKTSTIYAVARMHDGSLVSGNKNVKVTIGGCGGGSSASYQSRSFITYQRSVASRQNREQYGKYNNNGIVLCQQQPLSTFSIDVDTGSYSNVRRFIMTQGKLPQLDAVRIEEMVNYFNYDYAPPEDKSTPFAIHTELGPNPWNHHTRLLHIGLKGYEEKKAQLPPANLVFLLDVSGSMAEQNKLPLLVSSLKLLTRQLRARDRISIVVYAGASGVVLPATPGNKRERIINALEKLDAGGSTNGGAGIQLAYSLAQASYIDAGINRVILATDGDFNVGVTGHDQLIDLIKEYSKKGISLTTLGFGTGNYNEKLMEQLADHGNGNYAYIDTFMEAKKVLVEQMAGTLFTIARDVKIQVEFNPAQVAEYRLIGYENRLLRPEDFRNDQVDAGDIGAGHTVTAIYELTMADSEFRYVPPLRYTKNRDADIESNDIATIKLRYKLGESNVSDKVERVVQRRDVKNAMNETSADYRLSASVAAFGQWLRRDKLISKVNLSAVSLLARTAREEDEQGYRREFIRMIETASQL